VTIRFQDQPDVKNYYEIAIYSKYDPMFDDKDFVFIYSSDLSHTRGAFDDNILLDDDSFDGTIKEIELKIERRNVVAPAEFYLEFRSINEGFYKYTKTLNQWGNVNDNPFASPVQIFSNVDQGLGVIALKNTDLVRIF